MKRKLLGIIIFLGILLMAFAFFAYTQIYSSNVPLDLENKTLFIDSSSNFDQLKKDLIDGGYVKNIASFDRVAGLMKFSDANLKSGKYTIEAGMNNRQLVGLLRSGNQTPVKLVFNNMRTLDQFCGEISKQVEFDSLSLYNYLTDEENLEKWSLDKDNIITLFIPNTYELYWNTSVENFTNKMIKEQEKFWKAKNRLDKLNELNLTKTEAITLASIVQKETLKNDEKPTVAGVYMNRLKRGIPLQADPTVVFAIKQFDIKRVLNKHLKVDSPFNTYIYDGLPPGPICMPDQSSIDAVLNFEKHKYLYFCAKPDYSGYHNFAKNLIAHNKNAKVYHRWLNKQKIK